MLKIKRMFFKLFFLDKRYLTIMSKKKDKKEKPLKIEGVSEEVLKVSKGNVEKK